MTSVAHRPTMLPGASGSVELEQAVPGDGGAHRFYGGVVV